MEPKKSLLVGTKWGETHAKAYRLCRDIRLVGICGHSNAEQLEAMRKEYNIPYASFNLAELIELTRPDVIDVACNPHYRLEAVQIAVNFDYVKLINLEKPVSLTPQDAYEIERLCREHNKLLTVNHQKKRLPAWCKAKAIIESGEIGIVEFFRASCQGNILEQGTHLMDMVMFFNGYPSIRWVSGQVEELEGMNKSAGAAPDSAVAQICFENDVRASFEFGSCGRDLPGESNKWFRFFVEAYGSRGKIRIGLNSNLETFIYGDDKLPGRTTVEPSEWGVHYVQAMADHLDSLSRYIDQPEKGHMSDLDKSMMSFQAIMGVYKSSLDGGFVQFPQKFQENLVDRLRAASIPYERRRV
ncbi:Gfo/Idh/MocA family protein [Paenibacillus solisilvae]|uniref:Gfo/Idh/MocA family protein n=1 Tax=Paenibacillus solisilvae TaxID=2486751 RepID=A0ABW0VTU6_9BACL